MEDQLKPGRSSFLPWHLADGGWIVPNEFPSLAQPSWLLAEEPACSRLSVSVLAVAQGSSAALPGRWETATLLPLASHSQIRLLGYIQGFTVVRGRLGSNGVALL